MAISDDYPGLKAEVFVDGQPLQEYDDNEDEAEPNAITKYIEASSGKNFALKFKFNSPFPTKYGVEIRVTIDGERSRVVTCQPELLYRPDGIWKLGVSFQKDGQWFRQKYRFTALNIVEEVDGAPNAADLRKDLDSKGSIHVSFRFITNFRRSGQSHSFTRTNMLQTMGAIPEKALKGDARSHQATLGEPERTRPRHPHSLYDYVHRKPFTTFIFKYRSLAALKALRIIGDDEEEDKKPEDGMTPEQLREALRHARKADRQAGKREDAPARNVKREHADVVDLAGDDDDDDEVTIVNSRRKRPRDDSEVIVLD